MDNNNSILHKIFLNEADELKSIYVVLLFILSLPLILIIIILSTLFTNFGNSCFKEEYRDYDESFI